MIHNTFLVLTPTGKVLASVQYWPVEVSEEQIREFVSTREELKNEQSDLEALPLIIG